jgi:hypothetical protein
MGSMTEDEQKFKGAGFNGIVEAIRERYGDAGLQKVLKRCSPDVRALTSRKVLDNEWVADDAGAELMEMADKVLSNGDWTLMRWIGYKVAKIHLRGIYKVFVKFTTFKSILKRANVVWKKYYTEGELKVVKWEKGLFQFEVVGYKGSPSNCMGVLGWLDMFLEVYKVKGGRAEHDQCRIKGSDKEIYTITWDEA